jgi:hypothetical protein
MKKVGVQVFFVCRLTSSSGAEAALLRTQNPYELSLPFQLGADTNVITPAQTYATMFLLVCSAPADPLPVGAKSLTQTSSPSLPLKPLADVHSDGTRL